MPSQLAQEQLLKLVYLSLSLTHLFLFPSSQFGQFDYSQSGGQGYGGEQQQYGGGPPTQSPYVGSIMTPDPVNMYSAPDGVDDFENEPPLMEGMLGINQMCF